jgi:AcrR family transcriptional regulator
MMSATQPQEPASRSGRDRSEATRSALIDLAVELFSTRGYAETSMRDIAREGPVSMGAIYLHFKNKAELLAQALETKISEDLEAVNPSGPVDHVERLTSNARDIAARHDLRALLVQAAAAAQTDDEARTRIREAQEAHVDDWIERYEADRERLELDRDLDLPTAVLYTWASELGLGMLEAFGMGPLDPNQWADIQNRVARSFRLPKDAG